MKRNLLAIGLFLYAGALLAQEPVTLPQCHEWAIKNYPQIKQFGLIEQTGQQNRSNINKQWLPQVAVNGKATYQSEVTKLPFDAGKMSALIPGMEIPVLSKDQYQLAAEINQTIWDGGITRASRQLSQAQTQAEAKNLEKELYPIKARINQLYFGILLQESLLRQNRLLQNDLSANISRVEAMIDNGVANLSDKHRFEAELLTARQNETELEEKRRVLVALLAVWIGKPQTTLLQLEEPPLPQTPLSNEINRPELKLFDANRQVLNRQNEQLTSQLMPRLGAFVQGGYGRPGLNMLANEFSPFYIAGVRLSWNMGRLYTLKNDRRKINTSLQSIDVMRETFLFNTRLEMMQQEGDIRKARELVQSDSEIVRLRNQIREAAQVKLENGVISATDLILEINAEDLARQKAALHRIEQLMAIYNYLYINSQNEK